MENAPTSNTSANTTLNMDTLNILHQIVQFLIDDDLYGFEERAWAKA